MDGIFGIGPMELIFIAILALIILGPERLPGVIRQVGRQIRAIRSMSNQFTEQFSEELKTLDEVNPNRIVRELLDDPQDKNVKPKPAAKPAAKTTSAPAKPPSSAAPKPHSTAAPKPPAKTSPTPASTKAASTSAAAKEPAAPAPAAGTEEKRILPPAENPPPSPAPEASPIDPETPSVSPAALAVNGTADAAEETA